jgi:peptidoglycan hydrolase-like protein with peptidoglycan-binding domain
MKRKSLVIVLFFLAAWSSAWADQTIESAQQKLKDQGFYYGDITGKQDADTTAAIRRYQIRNGLQITGEINAETQRSLGLKSKPASASAPPPAQTPGPTPPGFIEETPAPKVTPAPRWSPQPDDAEDTPDYPSPPRPLHFENGGLFDGTPYQAAPLEVQRDVIISAQSLLLREGFYREAIDGIYRAGMKFALRNYQARFGLRPSGRLDVETLASLSLLPGQRTSGFRRFHWRIFSPRTRIGPDGEPIYIPR